MTGAGDGVHEGDGSGHARLGDLCRRLAETAGPLLPDARGQRLIEELTARIRAGRTPEELEEEFDELEELLLAAGHSAGLGSYRGAPRYRGLPGSAHGHPALYVLACPGGHCARLEAPDPDADRAQVCRILGRPLREVGLRRP